MKSSVRTDGRRAKLLLGRILLAVASTVFALVALEAAYRLKLFLTVGHSPLGMSETYLAFNDTQIEYDHDFGYRYRPHTAVAGLRVTNRVPVLNYRAVVNEIGNIDPPKPDYATSELKVLVFGDSFTDAQRDGYVWPSLLEDRLSTVLSRRACVLNFGRGGYGIVQMFDLAISKIAQWHPDVVVIAFISDDLNRARFWKSSRQLGGQVRESISADPIESETRQLFNTLVINRAITPEWCEQIVKSGDTNDPLLRELNQQFAELRDENRHLVGINYSTPSTSMLYNRLKYNDPFFAFTNSGLNPRLKYFDFGSDKQMLEKMNLLRNTGVPCYLVHLPEYKDLEAGRYVMTAQQSSLLASLEKHTGLEAIGLLDSSSNIEDPKRLFLLPNDQHPSLAGLRFYANAVAEKLIQLMGNHTQPAVTRE